MAEAVAGAVTAVDKAVAVGIVAALEETSTASEVSTASEASTSGTGNVTGPFFTLFIFNTSTCLLLSWLPPLFVDCG